MEAEGSGIAVGSRGSVGSEAGSGRGRVAVWNSDAGQVSPFLVLGPNLPAYLDLQSALLTIPTS